MERATRRPKEANSERRSSTRFPLTLEARYTLPGRRAPVEKGSARTIDLSSSGLAFDADKPLQIGQKIHVAIDWPALLDGSVQLQLIVSGRVVRTMGTTTALQIEQHEFRTRRV
jgi:hypothetical protein